MIIHHNKGSNICWAEGERLLAESLVNQFHLTEIYFCKDAFTLHVVMFGDYFFEKWAIHSEWLIFFLMYFILWSIFEFMPELSKRYRVSP